MTREIADRSPVKELVYRDEIYQENFVKVITSRYYASVFIRPKNFNTLLAFFKKYSVYN